MGHDDRIAGTLPAWNPIADDGDEARFCSTCAFGAVCLGSGVDKLRLAELHYLVEHVGPYAPGQAIFRSGQRFGAIYAVRAGTVMTQQVDIDGREQVLGFHLPGELIGLNAIHPEVYPCDAVALDTVEVCRFSFPALSSLATRIPQIQTELFRRLSQSIGEAHVRSHESTADERMAAFLLNLDARYVARGFPPGRLHLAMSRGNIANYLGLAAETVSRVLRRFQDGGLIGVDGRSVELLNPGGLRDAARALLG